MTDEVTPQQAEAKQGEEVAAEAVPVDVASLDANAAVEKGTLAYHPQLLSDVLPHEVPDYTIVFGRRINANLYVVVFAALAVLTALEIAIAEIFEYGFPLRNIALVVTSVIKAVLVMLFYMHLRQDTRIFAVAIVLPMIIGMVALLFLVAVPSTGY